MSSFVLGFCCGIAFAALVMFVVGAFLVAQGDRVDNAADEHGEALGFDPGVGLDRE